LETDMNALNNEVRELSLDEIEVVSGATVQQIGYGPNRLNISPWGLTTPFDVQWALVGLTGHL
jgi:hypothetical protein